MGTSRPEMNNSANGVMKCLSDEREPPNQICIFEMEEELRAESANAGVEAGRND